MSVTEISVMQLQFQHIHESTISLIIMLNMLMFTYILYENNYVHSHIYVNTKVFLKISKQFQGKNYLFLTHRFTHTQKYLKSTPTLQIILFGYVLQ